jgi:hypothetical protein
MVKVHNLQLVEFLAGVQPVASDRNTWGLFSRSPLIEARNSLFCGIVFYCLDNYLLLIQNTHPGRLIHLVDGLFFFAGNTAYKTGTHRPVCNPVQITRIFL